MLHPVTHIKSPILSSLHLSVRLVVVGGTADELDANDIVVKLAGVKVGTDFNLQLIDGELHAVAIA